MLKKANKIYKVCFWLIMAVLLLIVNIWSYRTQAETPYYETSGIEYDKDAELDFTYPFTSRSDEFIQKFVPALPHLEEIELRFDFTLDKEAYSRDMRFFIGLYDGKGSLLWNSEIIPAEIDDLQYVTFEIDRDIDTRETYQIKIYPQSDIEINDGKSVSMHCFLTNADLPENRGCSFKGEELNGNTDIIYQYKYYDIQPFYKIIWGDILLVLFAVAMKLAEGTLHSARREKVVGGIVWGITPLAMYFIFESVIGNFATIQGKYFMINIFLFYILYFVFSLCWKNLRTSAIVFSVALLALAFTQYYVSLFRGRPFMLFDIINIRTAFTVVNSYVFEMPVRMGGCLQVFLGSIIAQHSLQKLSLAKKRKVIIVRVLGLAVFISIMTAALKTGVMRKLGFEGVDFWNLNANYEEKGTLYTLLLECSYNYVEKPAGYSPEKAQILAANSKAEAETVKQPENLIVIMNESLADFDNINVLKTDSQILPYMNRMADNTIKGWLQMPVYGAGTAESEYEVLTGNSKQFLSTGSTAYEIYCKNPEYGLAWTLKQQGYRTIALHPYLSENWNRSTVYPEMGFDEFFGIENWGENIENIRWCASDKSAYEKIERLIEEKKEGEKIFTFLVTMQNHGGYGEDSLWGYVPSITLNYGTDYPLAETCLSLINESDRAFHDLITYFEKVDEPTMIVMFGDHFPAVEEEFYNELFEGDMSDSEMERSQLLYQTPYVIWTNYEHESKTDENMSANFLSSYVLQQAGLELTAYNKFLLNLKETIPVIGMGAVCDYKGEWYALDGLTKEYETLINQYKTIQYNNVIDRRHMQENIFTLSDEG